MHHEQSHETARALVAPFYDVLTRPSQKNVAAIVSEIAIPEWRSYAGETVSKGREEFIAQVIGFGRAIPDLVWDVKEVLVSGDRIIVRSEARVTSSVSRTVGAASRS